MVVTGYMVFRQSADSYHSTPELPARIFLDEDRAIEFAKTLPGYGLNYDWFIRPVPVDVERQ